MPLTSSLNLCTLIRVPKEREELMPGNSMLGKWTQRLVQHGEKVSRVCFTGARGRLIVVFGSSRCSDFPNVVHNVVDKIMDGYLFPILDICRLTDY